MPPRVLLSWSSGKDSAWTLHVLRQQDVDVVGLLTTFNEAAGRVAMHAVRRTLVEAQATAAGLPLWQVPLPWPCSNATYEQRMLAVIARAREEGITHVAFGDLFLQDIRDYRVRQLAATGIEPLFPLWCSPADTPDLARRMLGGGLRAVLTCADPRQLPEAFVGRPYDTALLADLPPGVDPCGERGEFHTFCFGGPMFTTEIAVQVGETVSRDGFCFVDLLPRAVSGSRGRPARRSGTEDCDSPTAVGLCWSCRRSRRVQNRRGSVFFRCSRAESDRRFARYPRLPVRTCSGYEESLEPEKDDGSKSANG